jgi:hypothetical protein
MLFPSTTFSSAASSIARRSLRNLLADLDTAAGDGTGQPMGPALERVRVEAHAVLSHVRAGGVP